MMMDDLPIQEQEADEDEAASAETVAFPFDRMTVQRFREAFPRARWSDSLGAWRVPGKTARRRIERWLAREATRADAFANEKGRDAYEWEPILSPYLDVGEWGFCVRTPYSRTVVEELRQIPFARWNGGLRAWEIPFASYDELQHRWQVIEEAARHAEPEARRLRAEARKGSEEEAKARRWTAERRRRRLPVAADALPPLERPVATSGHGIVLIEDLSGELAEPEDLAEFYPRAEGEQVWCHWRLPTLDELVHTWPAKHPPSRAEQQRGWWQPTLDELRAARRVAKTRERRRHPVGAEDRPDAS